MLILKVQSSNYRLPFDLHLRVEEVLDILVIGHVAAGAEDCKVGNLVQSLNVAETSQRSVRRQVVCRHHHSAVVLDSQH